MLPDSEFLPVNRRPSSYDRRMKLVFALALIAGGCFRPVDVTVLVDGGRDAVTRDAETRDPTNTEIVAQIDRKFYAEPADAPWGQSHMPRLLAHLEACVPAGTIVERAECRATLCRIQAAHVNQDAYGRYVAPCIASPGRTLWNAGVGSFVLDDSDLIPADRPLTSVSYVAREDEEIPLVDPVPI